MLRLIAILLDVVFVSLYFFPFEFQAVDGVNTKMVMAVVGLAFFVYRIFQGRRGHVGANLFGLSAYAAVVSFCGFFAVTVNNTPDYAYVTYLLSMWVWISGAYAVCSIIRAVHGRIDIELLCRYLATVCVLQCMAALLIDHNPQVKELVDSVVQQGQEFLNRHNVKRLYGIGASLDVAGSRFSAVLVLLAVVIVRAFGEKQAAWLKCLYLMAFAFIAIVGNMIARTTTVGLAIALAYWIFDSNVWRLDLSGEYKQLALYFLAVVVVAVPVSAYFYETDDSIRRLLRFGFEGFFNMAEKGRWEVTSNDQLRAMVVFPETLKTWIIGDGYFSNPKNTDPYFIGEVYRGYYMGTDVGYLRFIFYFGIIGLAAFAAFLIRACRLCINTFPEYRLLFNLLLAVNFAVWFKVSTDIFLVFALFLMSPEENKAEVPTATQPTQP